MNSMKLNLPSLETLLHSQKQAYLEAGWGNSDVVHQVVSPYRICPLGAHVDHQGGRVFGRTINAYSILTFSVNPSAKVRLKSEKFSGVEAFTLAQAAEPAETSWGRYLRGAASVLMRQYPLKNGIDGQVLGSLPGGGLSSSASVGLAYLHALAFANQISLSQWEAIELDRQLENDYLGLANGILDQSMIELGREASMLYLDTHSLAHEWVEDPEEAKQYRFLIVYSGFSRSLVSTGFNDRVGECRQAAGLLGKLAGIDGAQILSDVPPEVFERQPSTLPKNLRKRAAHYYSEVSRVDQGHGAWKKGDMAAFGALMNESCHSSISQYESGSEPIIRLHEIVSGASGVLGSRFGGGGYGGCVIGLAALDELEKASGEVLEKYLRLYPEMEDVVKLFTVANEGGVRVL
jgi:galactokinase/galacturonokinase